MRKGILIFGFTTLTILGLCPVLFAQGGRAHIREGNRQYNQKNYSQSELEYRKALERNSNSVEGLFNLGAAKYRQEKFSEAAESFSQVPENLKDPLSIASFHHNMGNSLLKSQQIQQSIEAYKQALRHNPNDNETRYNLAYAQHLLNQQQQSQNQDQKQDEDNQNKQDGQNKQNQDNKQEDQKQDEPQKQEQQSDKPDRISREDAERLLQAVENEDRNVQDKLKREQTREKQVRILRNW